jgi:hypothetical protein
MDMRGTLWRRAGERRREQSTGARPILFSLQQISSAQAALVWCCFDWVTVLADTDAG